MQVLTNLCDIYALKKNNSRAAVRQFALKWLILIETGLS
jgi:hypothetical protein